MDKEALFRTAIEDNRDRIIRLCCNLVADPDARQDVYQEVLLHIWKGLERFHGRSQLNTWVYRIAVNTCITFRRSEQRRRRRFNFPGEPQMEMIPDPWKPSEFQDEQVRHLYAGIRRLPPLECALVSLYLDDVSTCDIAEILGISEVNVRVKLHRAKKNLKEIMEHSDGTG